MERITNLFKNNRTNSFFLLGLFLFIKTYFITRFLFDLPIENPIEELIIVINSLVTVGVIFTLVVFLSRKKNLGRNAFIASFIVTFLLYANAVYYRFFSDFITIPVLFQVKNFSDLGGSAAGLISALDLILFTDLIILSYLIKKGKIRTVAPNRHIRKTVLSFTAILFFVNALLAESQRPQLFTRIFDREMVVKYLGVVNYHIFDLVVHSKTTAQRTFAEGSDVVEVENYVKHQLNKENSMTGVAEGKNVILISMESIQNFLINYKVEGQEVTPFLNDLIGSSFYFDNFYHQTAQGKTSDSEFLVDNSMYPLSRGAVFTTNGQNKYYALPEILGDNGYFTTVFHGNNKSFWNRDLMYQSLGYDKFFSETYYDVTEENSINYGLKDIPFFQQSIPLMEQLEKPFHAKFITLTHHYPFILDEEDIMIPATQTGNGTVDRYFQTARYFDESLKIFFEDLKKSGLYDESIFILYGDHYGISDNHNRAMSEIIGKEVTPYEHVQLQKVPLLIHIPGMEGKTISTVSGQVDLKPTILNLLGIEIKNDIQFGFDLFDEERREFAILRDGSYINEDYVFTKEKCYQKPLGTIVENVNCEKDQEIAERELELSDKVIQRDLLRFVEFK